MGSILDQNVDISNVIEETNAKKSAASAPLLNTKETNVSQKERPRLNTDLGNLLTGQSSVPLDRGGSPAVNYSNEDFYQTTNMPAVTGSGFFTTIAPTGALFPYAALMKMNQERDMASAAVRAKKDLDNTWDFQLDAVNQPIINDKLQNTYFNLYSNTKKQYEKLYGSNAIYEMKKDPSVMGGFNKLNQLVKSLNEDVSLATGYIAQDKDTKLAYKDKIGTKAAYDLLQGHTEFLDKMENGGGMNDVNEWYKAEADLKKKIIARADIFTGINTYAKTLNDGAKEITALYRDNGGLGNAANNVNIEATTKAPFLDFTYDKDGKITDASVNEQKLTDSWAKYYETYTGTTLDKDGNDNYILNNGKFVVTDDPYGKERAYDPNAFIRDGVASTAGSLKKELKSLSTDAAAFQKNRMEQERYDAKPYFKTAQNQQINLPSGKTVRVDYTPTSNITYDEKTGKPIGKPVVYFSAPVTGRDGNGNPIMINEDVDKTLLGVIRNVTPEQAAAFGLKKNTSTIQVISITNPKDANKTIQVYEPYNNRTTAAIEQSGAGVEGINIGTGGSGDTRQVNPNDPTTTIPIKNKKVKLVSENTLKDNTKAEYNAMPSGSIYIRNGVKKTKP